MEALLGIDPVVTSRASLGHGATLLGRPWLTNPSQLIGHSVAMHSENAVVELLRICVVLRLACKVCASDCRASLFAAEAVCIPIVTPFLCGARARRADALSPLTLAVSSEAPQNELALIY